jgi:hypothetical protein
MLYGRKLNRKRDRAEEVDNERVHREGAGAAWHDYTQSVYVNNHTPLRIICPDHGPFDQRSVDHMLRRGC